MINPWKLPLGYFLTNGNLTSEQQKILVKDLLERFKNINVNVHLFDGASTNIGTANFLGAQLPSVNFFCIHIFQITIFRTFQIIGT